MAEKKEYTPSAEVTAAALAAEEAAGRKPGEYRSGWESQLQAVMDRILNREEFRYNLNGDALYKQYREQAVRNGQRAMEDSMGRAAALTGGYGNSYAQAAGQQAYWKELEGVNQRIPELYALALDQYRQQSQGLQAKYDLLNGAERQDYSRYRDAYAAWEKEADDLRRAYTDLRDTDYSHWRDEIDDWKWQQNFDESARRYNQEWDAKHPTAPEIIYTARPSGKTSSPAKPAGKDEGTKVKVSK